MNNLKLLFFSLFIVLFITFIALKKGPLFVLFQEGKGDFTTQIKKQNEGQEQSFPKTLIDATGIRSVLKTAPKRILSATLVSDHILAGLVDPSRIVAVSSYVDYPSLSNIIGFYPENISRTTGEIESMLALQPDLVFVASYSNPETVRYLLRSGIAIVRLSEFNSFKDIFNNIRLIANVTDSQNRAEKMINNIQKRIGFIKKEVADKKRPKVLYYDLNGYSVGKNSLMDEAIQLAGGINISASVLADGENKITEELAISLQADVIIMNQWVFNQQDKQANPAEILKAKAAWQNVPAIKNNRVVEIPGTLLRSVSQYRIKGVEAMAKLLHPKVYHDQEKTDVQ